MTKYTAFTIKNDNKIYSLNIDYNGFSEEGNITFPEALNIAAKAIGSNSIAQSGLMPIYQLIQQTYGWYGLVKKFPHAGDLIAHGMVFKD